MIVFSHIEVGNYYFHAIRNCKELSFKLRWGAFIFGNVFPDISKFASRKHFYDVTKSVYTCYLKKARNPDCSDRDRSMALGVVCHFICDYFCKYHAKTPYTRQSMAQHTLYEVFLHMKIMILLFKKSIGILREAEISVFSSAKSHPGEKENFDLEGKIKEYENEEESLLTDMVFAFDAVRSALNEIIGAETTYIDKKNRNERTPVCTVTA